VVREVGYEDADFDSRSCTVISTISELPTGATVPPDGDELELGATDQVTVFGYACQHTPNLMPLPISVSHKLARQLSLARREGVLGYLAPEAKTQVGVEFADRRPRRIYSVSLIASQHEPDTPSIETLRRELRDCVVETAFADEEIRPDANTRIDINPGGPLIRGGPAVHSGLTGRKTAVDTYGDFARNGSMALSGKDPSRIGRTGVYASRYAAKQVVAAGVATECEVQLSYTPGTPGPVSVEVETFGTAKVPEETIVAALKEHVDFRVAAIIRQFRLRELPGEHADGFYRNLASFGQVGRTELDLPWEAVDKRDIFS
jgi:S-adenosylmethionine synthetase